MKFLKNLPLNTIFAISTLIILTLLLIFTGFSIFIIIFLVLALFLYFLFFTQLFKVQLSNPMYIWIFLAAFFILNIGTGVLIKTNSKTSVKPLTPEQCAAIYNEYDSTILDLTADGFKGTIGIKINPEDCRATVDYNFLYTTNLSKNFQVNEYAREEYEYTGVLRDPSKDRKYSDYGVLFPVYKNKNTLPNPYSFGIDQVDYSDGTEESLTTTFYQGLESSYIFREDSFEKLISKTVYEIVDASDSMDIEQFDENGYSYSQNSELAAENGNIIQTFNLTITERN